MAALRDRLLIEFADVVSSVAPEAAVVALVESLVREEGWDAGHAWAVDELDRLRPGAAWSSNGFDALRDACRVAALRHGFGVAGRALAEGVVCIAPGLEATDPLDAAALAEGMRGAAAIPVTSGGRAWALIELFRTGPANPDDEGFVRLCERAAVWLGRAFELDRRRRRERFSDAIFDHVADPIFVKDRQFRFVLLNRALCELVGYAREDMLGKTDYDFFPKAQADFFRLKDVEMFSTASKVVIDEEPITDASGGQHWLATTKVPLLDARGQVTHLVGIIHDITQLRAAQRERTVAYEQLEAVNRELEAFSYSVSHDLRAPLRVIDGFSLAAIEDAGDRLDPVTRDQLDRVRRAAQRMGRLIDDLLALSRVTRAPLRRVRVDVSAVAQDVVADLRAVEPERTVVVEIAPGLAAFADPALTRVVLDNLLANAWKFTSATDGATIVVGAGEAGGIYVRDNGAGFDPAGSERMFRPFTRLHEPGKFPGSGVGLATVMRIVQRHSGDIRAEGRPGAGATLTFTLGPVNAPG